MDAERWSLIGEILADAVELSARERKVFLASRCAEDPELLREVEELLAAYEDGGLLPEEPDAEPADLEGRVIGHYRVDALIGAGGMGRVYRAVDTALGREVALKVLPEGHRTDPNTLARFRREARILASLNHPNIGTIYELEEWEGHLVLVLEFVEGPTLAERLKREPLSVGQVVDIAVQIVRALDAAHERGVVHRDLKPANVLLAPNGVVKVLDFGIAKPIRGAREIPAPESTSTGSWPETLAGRVYGTPGYMSPEQILRRPVDTRADLWSFGILLFRMLAGRGPFDDVDFTANLTAVLDQEPAWESLPTSLPASLRRLLERCLVKDPEQRMPTIREALPYLEDARREAATSGWTRALGRHRAILAVGALVVVLAGAALARIGFSGDPDEGPTRVLVLPFQFLGGEEDAYLAQGVSEEISGRLSGLRNLTVLGRQTALHVARRDMDAEEIARDVDADFILDGTVRLQRSADGPGRLRIRAALTSGETLTEVWSETYDGFADDVFRVQAEVAARVAEAMGVELPGAAGPGSAASPDLAAYDFFLRGNEYSRRSELETSMRSALAMYEEATQLDPGFAAAWAAQSIMRSRLRWRAYEPSAENLERARTAAEQALALNPEEAYGHLALGYYHYYGSRAYESALEHFLAAQALRPQDPETHYAVGIVARRKGDWDVAVDALERALSTNPRHAEVAIILGETYIALDRFEDARQMLDRAVAIAPDRPGAYIFRTWLSLAAGDAIGPAVQAVADGWDQAGGPRLFELTGRYVSQIDWWIPRVLGRDERYRQMFEGLDLLGLGVDSAAHYLHHAEFHRALGRSAIARTYADSARMVLEARVARDRTSERDDLSVLERSQRANRMAHLALAYVGLGRAEEALATAREAAGSIPPEHDALHGSEVHIELGLVQAMLGDREGAIRQLAEMFARPSSFRPGMLRHDPTLAPLLDDPRLRDLAVPPR